MIMSTHMKKVEVISALRCLASKYAEQGDYVQSEQRLIRAETLTMQHIQNPNNFETLYNKITSCDVKLRRTNLTDSDKQQVVKVMEEAVKIAENIYGKHSVITG